MLPPVVLLDLDDTILNDSGNVDSAWEEACVRHHADLPDKDPLALLKVIDRIRNWYWSDVDRHRTGRLDLTAARREIVRMSCVEVGSHDVALAHRIADTYTTLRDVGMEPLPDAIDTVRWLRSRGCRLALLTNGGAASQRAKIARFELEQLFDLILIEGEVGFGKPDPRLYSLALDELNVPASDTWMVGDNLEWDVAQPQRMGIFSIWIDVRGAGLPESSAVRPNRTVRSLSELRKNTKDTKDTKDTKA